MAARVGQQGPILAAARTELGARIAQLIEKVKGVDGTVSRLAALDELSKALAEQLHALTLPDDVSCARGRGRQRAAPAGNFIAGSVPKPCQMAARVRPSLVSAAPFNVVFSHQAAASQGG